MAKGGTETAGLNGRIAEIIILQRGSWCSWEAFRFDTGEPADGQGMFTNRNN